MSFAGATSLTLDGKGRLTVPVRHRDALMHMAQGQLAITKHPDRCLIVYPRPAWESFRAKVAALPGDALAWKRMILGFASEVEIDGASRILIDKVLRDFAGIERERDVLLLGMDDHFEIWDSARHADHEARTMSEAMPDSIKSFAF